MNRQIKFKLWDTQEKAFDWGQNIFVNTRFSDTALRDCVGTPVYYKDRFILCQATGLEDKNDKEIYEGDILRILDNEVEGSIHSPFCHVWYSDLSAQWMASYNHMYSEVADELWRIGTVSEIVGNIFENPFPPNEKNE